MKVCLNNHCTEHKMVKPSGHTYCFRCSHYLTHLQEENTSKKVCVKTAVLDVMRQYRWDLVCIERDCERDSSELAYYTVRKYRQDLEKKIIKIEEISADQYESACLDIQD